MSRSSRVSRLEEVLAPAADQKNVDEAASAFRSKLSRMSGAFSEEDAALTLDDRLKLSPASHCAWALRFDPTATLASIMQMHPVMANSPGLMGRRKTEGAT